MEMNKDTLRAICKEHDLYRTPSLNDKLYCNFKGFRNIGGLEEYVNLRALFLEGNAIDSLSGLPALTELRCLFMQNNCIRSLEPLDRLVNLDTLNISNNPIEQLQGLDGCENLRTLIATNMHLETYSSVAHLENCPGLHTVDLQGNRLEDPNIIQIFLQMPNLRCLYLKGNPVVSKVKNYRKTLIAGIPSLTYLDDRPVFDLERRCAEAWADGGVEAERQARDQFNKEKEMADRRNYEYMLKIREEGWARRRAKQGLEGKPGDPYMDDISDSEYDLYPEEPPELMAARQRLEAYTGESY